MDNMENPDLTIELTLNEINMILSSLGKHPFDDISHLIGKIRSQGEDQIKVLQEASAVEEADLA
jgi:hypothetical protein